MPSRQHTDDVKTVSIFYRCPYFALFGADSYQSTLAFRQYSIAFSSSNNEEETTDLEYDEHGKHPAAVNPCNDNQARVGDADDFFPADPTMLTYGPRDFWLRLFNDDDLVPLAIIDLPQYSDKVARLELTAASRYNGPVTPLPKILAARVLQLRAAKRWIFGADLACSGTSLRPNTDNYALYLALSKQVERITQNESVKWQPGTTHFLYHYRVVFNGVLCGKVRGPKAMCRSFVRKIHLALGLFRTLRLHGSDARWYTRGFSVYRFTPIPYVTVLRIVLYNKVTHQRDLIHVTREPE